MHIGAYVCIWERYLILILQYVYGKTPSEREGSKMYTAATNLAGATSL
jgi:hypothetical protein